VLEFTVPDRTRIGEAVTAVAKIGEAEPHMDAETGVVSVGVGGRGSEALVEAVRGLDGAGVETRGLALRRPSLDDVFMALTGHVAEETGQQGRRRGRRRGAGKDGAGKDKAQDSGRAGDQERADEKDTARAAS